MIEVNIDLSRISGPDGMEERTAHEDEVAQRRAERADEEEAADYDFGQARVLSAFLDRLLK